MISVLTPTHNTEFLAEAYESLRAQSLSDWEWILLPNGGLTREEVPDFRDDRVYVCPDDISADCLGRVGSLKKKCASVASGDVLVELDHDDLLLPDALMNVRMAMDARPDAGMMYSNCAYINQDWSPRKFGEGFGWDYRERRAFDRSVLEIISPAPDPQNLSRIWYAPDHLRAYRASEYLRLGGHSDLPVADDHDLTLRFYLDSKILHVNDLMYVYRVHGGNTWLDRNAEVQEQQWLNYENYIQALALKWADANGLLALDLGGAHGSPEGFVSVDLANADIEADLNRPWPFPDSSVGVIRAADVIEHLKDPIHVMNEAWRVLAPGGFFLIEVPSTDGRGAFQDPTHVSFWNENSFLYWTSWSFQKYITHAGARARFQALDLRTYFPSDHCRQMNIPYVRAHLVAVKGRRFHGHYDFPEVEGDQDLIASAK